jgi:hypothetical protein
MVKYPIDIPVTVYRGRDVMGRDENIELIRAASDMKDFLNEWARENNGGYISSTAIAEGRSGPGNLNTGISG